MIPSEVGWLLLRRNSSWFTVHRDCYSVRLRIASDYSHQPVVSPSDSKDRFHTGPISHPSWRLYPHFEYLYYHSHLLVKPSPAAPATPPFPWRSFLMTSVLHQEVKRNHILPGVITQFSWELVHVWAPHLAQPHAVCSPATRQMLTRLNSWWPK